MKTFSFINLKGGVGKTTISKNTAVLINRKYNGRVLFIDNDKQGNSTRFFQIDADAGKSIADLFLNNASAAEVIHSTRYENLDIIPANMNLHNANYAVLKDEEHSGQFTVLCDKLAEVAENYDVCIIDNPPDINLSVANGLLVADEVILVATPDDDALDGVDEMLPQIKQAQTQNPTLVLRGCVLNQYISNATTYEYHAELRKRCDVLANIRFTKGRVKEANKKKVSIFEIADRCGFAHDIREFVAKLLYIRK